MRKFAIGTIQDYFKALIYTATGFLASFLPGGFLVFGAFGRMGGMNRYLAYVAVGFLIGMVTSLVGGLISSVTSFLPGIFGQVLGWGILGAIVTFLVSIVLRAFGARR